VPQHNHNVVLDRLLTEWSGASQQVITPTPTKMLEPELVSAEGKGGLNVSLAALGRRTVVFCRRAFAGYPQLDEPDRADDGHCRRRHPPTVQPGYPRSKHPDVFGHHGRTGERNTDDNGDLRW
jgi:hypothetical protein